MSLKREKIGRSSNNSITGLPAGTEPLKVPSHTPLGIRSASDQTQFASNLTPDLGSGNPFSLQMDPPDARSWFTLSQSMVLNPRFRKR